MKRFGPGRPSTPREIGEVTELTAEDLAVYNAVRESPPAFKKFRDSFHSVAKLAAIGLRSQEIAEATGYTATRINQLLSDPAMQAAVESYRAMAVDPSFAAEARSYMTQIITMRARATALINDKLAEAEPEDITYRDALNLATFAADRSGFGKVSTQKIELDLAERMERALAATGKVIEGRAMKLVEQKKEEAA